MEGEDGPEGTVDGGAGSLTVLRVGCLLRGGEATRDSKAWLEGRFDPVARWVGI